MATGRARNESRLPRRVINWENIEIIFLGAMLKHMALFELRYSLPIFFPALLIALYQVKVMWAKQPKYIPADTEIDGRYTQNDKELLHRIKHGCYKLFAIQLRFSILPITSSARVEAIVVSVGYVLIVARFFISRSALSTLGANWTGQFDYRIIKGQKLVKTGIYSRIRHPIYLAVILEVVGYELVANSYLVVPIGVSLLLFMQKHISYEERLLEQAFKDEWVSYKKLASSSRGLWKNVS